jgi:2-oxoglutarate dehydrogenase E2 component (dihydrolipoamide succinyltransferase)
VAAPAPVAQAPVAQAPVAQAPATQTLRPALSPTTRKHLREQGLDPSAVATAQPAAPVRTATNKPPVLSDGAGPEEVVTLSPLRKRIAERLVEAQHTAAILTTFNEVDMSYIMALRSKFQDEFVKKHGIKLGFMSFFVTACAHALREFPGLNAEMRGDAIVYKKHYDFGIAVGGGKGLVVPVLRNVDKMSLAEIEKGIAELAQKAKDNKLQLAELSGGTFSISNGGVYGSMMSTPLLNMPQTGILGMHNIVRRPIAVGDNIEIRPMMYIALSYDHRVVDGREAVSFLVRVKDRLESPEKILLGL